MTDSSVLFVSKNRQDPLAEEASTFITQNFHRHRVVVGNTGDPLPETVRNWEGDYIISYLAPWIIPQAVLSKARIAAINFHPGPPAYPGIGCYNFAVYDRVTTYGITCHHMAAAVDTGKIIAVRRFKVIEADTVLSIAKKSAAQMLVLFYEIMTTILERAPLPSSDENWSRRPFTKAEMYDLFRVTAEMPVEEIQRRVKAAKYPGWPGAYVDLGGHRFFHNGT